MCSASGAGGSQECQNTKIEDFINSLGFKGFKVYRNKTITGLNSGIYYDVVYVFPLQNKVKDEGLNHDDGVLFFLDPTQPTQEDFSTLDEVANSFFNF